VVLPWAKCTTSTRPSIAVTRPVPRSGLKRCVRRSPTAQVCVSVALRRDPEALLPRAARRNALELLVHAFLREVQGVGNRGHRLEGNETPGGRRRRTLGGWDGWRRHLDALS